MTIKSNVTKKTMYDIEKMIGVRLSLGKLLWAIRQADGISQVEFAKKLRISKQHLCDLEHDRKTVSPKLAARYATKLGYSQEQFIRLSLQDLVDRDGLQVEVKVAKKRSPKRGDSKRAA